MTCYTCEYFMPTAPSSWKPAYEGDKYDIYGVRREIEQTRLAQAGKCCRDPNPVTKTTNDQCAHYKSYFSPSAISKMFADEMRRGNERYWREKAEKAERALKAARKISASRLTRLQKADGKSKAAAPSLPQQGAAE